MAKKTMKLTLKRRWFLQILHGVKTVEYREIKTHWDHILFKDGKQVEFDQVQFTNGYGEDKPRIILEYKGMDYPVTYDGKECYAIKLGKIISTKNLKGKEQ